MVSPALRHIEMYTMRGLLSLYWHEPVDAARDVAVVMGGGAMGGVLGPGESLFHALGEELCARGIPTLRISWRKPNDLDSCCVDMAAAVQLAVGSGAERVVTMGHSFGGAVAVRVAVGLPDPRFGETICAVVEAAPGATPTLEELNAHVKASLAPYKAPRHLVVVDTIGRAPNGKVDYKRLKSVALERLGVGS